MVTRTTRARKPPEKTATKQADDKARQAGEEAQPDAAEELPLVRLPFAARLHRFC